MRAASHTREVVITGMGVVSPIGTGNGEFAASLRAGVSGIRTITLFDAARFSTTFAGEVRGFEPGRILADQAVIEQTSERRVLLACCASRLAADDAGLSDAAYPKGRSAVILGAGVHPAIPNMHTLAEWGIYQSMFNDPDPRPDKYNDAVARETGGENSIYPLANRVNAGTQAVARQHRITGPCCTIISACAAATQAIGHAYRIIQRGEADIAFTGGYDSMVFRFGIYAFCLLGLMSTRNADPAGATKPFDKHRDGFALGEGAGVLILEEKQRALERGAQVYGQVTGYSSSVDAHKITDPHPDGTGAALAMRNALRDAGLPPESIDYINAHGTATPKNDRIETAAIKNVFGRHAYDIPISSTKSMIGHLMAAGGALELIATVLGMHDGFIHPTINYDTPDPECDLDYVPNAARACVIRNAMSNSFGLGGQNASIIVSAAQ